MLSDPLLNLSSGALILVMIVLANIYQRRTMRKFSGVIGKVMLWYSLGLAALLVLTIFEWVVNLVELSPFIAEYGSRGFFVVAVAFFLQGARVIR